MKTTILCICMFAMTIPTQAQKVIYEAKISKEKIPEAVVNAFYVDYPGYNLEEVFAVPLEIIKEDVYVNQDLDATDDFDSYNLVLQSKQNKIETTYDKNGKLLNTIEHLKNVTPPRAVITTIAKTYPGWIIEKDSYNMVEYKNGEKKEHYRLVLTKNGKKIRVHTDAKGHMLNADHSK